MQEIKFCRNCEQWRTTTQWKGTCKLHPWDKDKYSEDATCYDCPDYVDKSKYQVAQKGREQ